MGAHPQGGPAGFEPRIEVAASFALMVEKVRDYAIFLIDTHGIVQTWNAAAASMKGYEAQEIVGRHFSVLYTEEDQERDWPSHNLQRAAEAGTYQEERWRRKKDGTRFWALVELIAIQEPGGELAGFCKITRDLTAHKALQEQLAREKKRAEIILRGIGDAVVSLDTSGQLEFLNPTAERLTGWPAEEARGKALSEVVQLLDDAGSGARGAELAASLAQGKPFHSGSAVLVGRDGAKHEIEYIGTPLVEEHARAAGGVVVMRDVTDRNLLEEALQEAGRRKDEFLAMLAHELRNPLAPISAAADLIALGTLDAEKVQSTSAIISRQVRHMSSLIDDLLDVSRVTRGLVVLEKSALDAKTVIADALEQIRPIIEARGHRLTMDLPPELALVSGDKKRLVQVVANLLGNAAKYTPDGGHIALRMEVLENEVCVSVRDDGIGMTPELMKDAFILFTQGARSADRRVGGLGIGLALVKSLVELHGGTVTVQSEGAGRGSTFTVLLPRLLESPTLLDVCASPSRLPSTQGSLRILVVDDNVDASSLMAEFLVAMGHKAVAVHSATEALECASVLAPQVCLLDIGLPGMNGLQLASALRERPVTRDAVLIAVTGYGQPQDIARALAAGFNHHLVKPVNTGELMVIITEVGNRLYPA